MGQLNDFISVFGIMALFVFTIFAILFYKILELALEYWRLNREFNMKELTHHNFVNNLRMGPYNSMMRGPVAIPSDYVPNMIPLAQPQPPLPTVSIPTVSTIPPPISPKEILLDDQQILNETKPSIRNFKQASFAIMNLPDAESKSGPIDENQEIVNV
jgi:hypothetical protein